MCCAAAGSLELEGSRRTEAAGLGWSLALLSDLMTTPVFVILFGGGRQGGWARTSH